METRHGITTNRGETFAGRLERARSQNRILFDLTEADPARCDLAWDRSDLEAIAADAGVQVQQGLEGAPARARDAVASDLAGAGLSIPPERIRFTTTRREAFACAFRAACEPGDEVIIASPSQPFVTEVATAESLRVSRCGLRFAGAWRLDRRALQNAVARRTRAIVVGNPSEPSGAILDREELAFLEQLCAGHGLALISDEAFAGTVRGSWVSALEVTRCLAVQVSGLGGVCGLPRFGAEWCVIGGPAERAAPALSRLDEARDSQGSISVTVLLSLPSLLARRERFLRSLRARLAANRASLAASAMSESPWSLLWGRGGCWGVLEIGAADDEEQLCLTLLDDGVAVHPGSSFGLPGNGYLAVSLLPPQAVFAKALAQLDRTLRSPLVR